MKPATDLRKRHVVTLRRLLLVAITASLALGASVNVAFAGPKRVPASGSADWTAYLHGSQHSSYAPSQTAITTANAGHLVQRWHDFPTTNFEASPTVAGGAVFVGSSQGWFYKLSATNGAVLDKVFLGTQPALSCPAQGVVSTATVATNPATGQSTVYVAAPDGFLYALRASNLSLEWRSVIKIPSATTNDYFNWSSPTVANGTVYVGLSSNCDAPLIRGGVIAYNQADGKTLAHFYTVPQGTLGGSVWSSVSVNTAGDVFATTGNGPESSQLAGNSDSIVKLAPRTLTFLGRFQIPASQVTFDADFGASPVMAGSNVGACNKNGIFYMLSQATMKVVWEQRVGASSGGHLSCIASPAVNGQNLYVAGVGAMIGGVHFGGSVQLRNASNGALVWQTGLGGGPFGSPALDGSGVLSVPINANKSMYLINASSGAVLGNLTVGSADFAQGVFAENQLFTANATGVYAWGP